MKVLRKMTNNVKWQNDLNMWQMWVPFKSSDKSWQKNNLSTTIPNSQWMKFKITLKITICKISSNKFKHDLTFISVPALLHLYQGCFYCEIETLNNRQSTDLFEWGHCVLSMGDSCSHNENI